MSLFDRNEMVVHRNNESGEIQSAGFSIQSELLKRGEPPLKTLNGNSQKGGSVSALLKDLAVPAGLFLLQQNYPDFTRDGSSAVFDTNTSVVEDDVVQDSLYDKLLKLSEYAPMKVRTRRVKKKKNRTTKKKK